MRKFWFLYLAKALILMPGGFGTLDELFEALTLLQTKKMKKRLPIVLFGVDYWDKVVDLEAMRSEEHTSELQSLMRISYAVFCLNTKTTNTNDKTHQNS